MKRQKLIVMFAAGVLLSGCSQTMQGQNPIIQLQAGHVVIETMQVGSTTTPEQLQALAQSWAEQAPAADQNALLDTPSGAVEKDQTVMPETVVPVEPDMVTPVEPAPKASLTDPQTMQQDDSGQTEAAVLDEGILMDSEIPLLGPEPQPAAPGKTGQSSDGGGAGFNDKLAGINDTAAAVGVRVEQNALAAEQKIADGYHWFVASMDAYQYRITDWWMRRRGLDPVAMR